MSNEDAGFVDSLRELPFVPVSSGALRCAEQLFHPRVSEAAELLDGAEVFPSGAFASAEVLSVLERLGMRVTVTRSAVLRSARSIEALASEGTRDNARARAQRLLSFVNYKLDHLPVDEGAPSLAEDTEFLSELKRIVWLPIVQSAPHPMLPWAAAKGAVLQPPTPCARALRSGSSRIASVFSMGSSSAMPSFTHLAGMSDRALPWSALSLCSSAVRMTARWRLTTSSFGT